MKALKPFIVGVVVLGAFVACLDFEGAYQDCRQLGNCVDPEGPPPPKVVATNPENLATNVELDTSISVEFDQPMKQDTVTATLTPDVSLVSPQWDETGTTVTFSPSKLLSFSTDYTLKVGGEAQSGGKLSLSEVAGFKTKADPPGPSLLSSAPAANATGVALDAGLKLQFSAELDPTSFLVSLNPPVALGTPEFGEGNTSVEFPVADEYLESTQYTVNFSGKGVDDKAITGTTSFGFQTVLDVTPPIVTSSYPMNGQTNVSPNSAPSIFFSEPMDTANTVGAVSISPADAGCTWSMPNTRTLTCTHANPFRGDAGFTITVSTAATDRATPTKLNLQQAYVVDFSTGSVPDTTKPDVSNTIPAASAQGISTTPTIYVYFTEPMDPLATQNAVGISSPGGITPTNFTWTSNNTRLSFTLSSTIAEYTTVNFQIGTSARDLAGNTLAAVRLFSFRTWKTHTDTIQSSSTLDGHLFKSGTNITPNTTYASSYVGDSSTPGTYRGFMSFPLTTLRNNGAIEITSAYIRVYQAYVNQRPYDGGLGELYMQNVRYGPSLGTDDWDRAAVEVCKALTLCLAGNGSTVIDITPQSPTLSYRYAYPDSWLATSLKAAPDAGIEDYFQVRLRFQKDVTSPNPSSDFTQISNGRYSTDTVKMPTLVVTYRAKQ